MNAIEKKRGEIAFAEIQLGRLRRDLLEMEANCPHNKNPEHWKVEYTPECRKGYTIPAEHCGSDSRPAMEVPSRVIDKWTRTCQLCGKVEVTDRVKEIPVMKKDPLWLK